MYPWPRNDTNSARLTELEGERKLAPVMRVFAAGIYHTNGKIHGASSRPAAVTDSSVQSAESW
jgi:hypothetical protein